MIPNSVYGVILLSLSQHPRRLGLRPPPFGLKAISTRSYPSLTTIVTRCLATIAGLQAGSGIVSQCLRLASADSPVDPGCLISCKPVQEQSGSWPTDGWLVAVVATPARIECLDTRHPSTPLSDV